MMIRKKLIAKFLVAMALVAMFLTAVFVGCTGERGPEGGDSERGAVSEVSERSGGESGGEHGTGGEGSGGEGSEGAEGSGGGEEASAAALAPDQTFDAVRGGARLVMNYDAAAGAFVGTVENTTNSTLTRVRIEVHVTNGPELGPTTPTDLAPGQVAAVSLPFSQAFTGWIAHAEVGNAEGGQSGESGGEGGAEGAGGEGHGPGGEGGSEGGGESAGEAAREAAMSSPITPLDQPWNGVLGGLAISARYDAATQSVQATVRNTTSQKLCYVQAEPHLKSGTQTVGELGPDVLGDLNPGQQAVSSVSVASEPSLAGVSFDGYVVHMEVFDCAGPGPMPHTGGEGAEGSGGEGAGGEGHGPGGEGGSEGSGSEGAEGGSGGSEEGSAAMLAPDQTFDAVRSGARLILNYNASTNAFLGTVENTTNGVLTDVRIEVHLSNGTELGPTPRIDLAPGDVELVFLPSTQASFTGWVAHAEVGGGESGGEHGSGSGSGEGGGEHGSGSGGGEGGGEHGSGGESGRG